MTDVKLSTIIMYSILTLFLFIGLMGFYIDISEEHDTELDSYITTTYSDYKTELTQIKNKSETLQNETVTLGSSVEDTNIGDNFIIKGWNTARNAIASTSQLITTSFKIVTGTVTELNLDGWILTILTTVLLISLIIIVLRISISRDGI
jgi:hypothetical protein